MHSNEIPAHELLAEALRAARSATSAAAKRAAIVEARSWAQVIQVARAIARRVEAS
jgi:hypothetical protein